MIGMLLETDYPKDIRVRKEAESLVSEGLEVVVITPWKKGMARKEVINGVNVHRIGKDYTFKRKGITDILSAVFFINGLFYWKLKKIIGEYSIEHLHVHDLPLTKTALKFRKDIPGKIVLDSHENYPELLEGWFMTKKSFFVNLKNKLLFSPSRWRRYEKRVLPKVDYLITVIDEMRTKFIANYNLDESKVLVVSNYEKLEFAELSEELEIDPDFEFEEGCFHIVYVGGIGPMRGLDTVIRAISQLKSKNSDTKLVILGSGNPSYVGELKSLAIRLEVEQEVCFLGYKDFHMVNYYMQKADVNIIPHVRNGHTDYTIPHKLFQIFLSKASLLVSSCKPLKRIVEGCEGGWVFEASSVSNLVEKVEEIRSSSKEEIVRRQENAFEAAMKKYNWDSEGKELASFYASLSK